MALPLVAALALGCGSAGAERPAGFDPLAQDPGVGDPGLRPDLVPIVIEGEGPRLLGLAFTGAGPGPRPTVLFLHGFPGHETNHDLARVLQRAGWTVIVAHYRGSWGSDGAFSFSGAREDAARMLEFVRDPANARDLRVDPDRIVLAGHSFGGFLALSVAAGDADVLGTASIAGFDMGGHARRSRRDAEALAATRAAFEEALPPLRGATAGGLVDEMLARQDEWSLAALVPRLVDRPTLLVAGARDRVAPPEIHHRPLARRFRAAGAGRATVVTLDAGHDFSSARVTLARHLLAWLGDLEGAREDGRDVPPITP